MTMTSFVLWETCAVVSCEGKIQISSASQH